MGGSSNATIDTTFSARVTADAAALVAPGKATRSEKLRPTDTLMYRGTASDRDEPGARTFFTSERRTDAKLSLVKVLDTATDNFRFAVQSKRIDLLTQKSSSSSFFMELLFDLATGPLVSIGTKAAFRMLSEHAGRVTGDIVGAAAGVPDKLSTSQQVAKDSINTVLRNAAKEGSTRTKTLFKASNGNHGKAEFLSYLADGAGAFSNYIFLVGTTMMDDVALQATVMGYSDLEAHSIAAYAAEVEAILARYEAHHPDDIGKKNDPHDLDTDDLNKTGETERDQTNNDWAKREYFAGDLAWVHDSRTRRLVILSGARDYNQKVVKVVDRDFEDYMIKLYIARTGQPPAQMVDLDDQQQLAANPWAYELWVGSQFYGVMGGHR